MESSMGRRCENETPGIDLSTGAPTGSLKAKVKALFHRANRADDDEHNIYICAKVFSGDQHPTAEETMR